MGPTKQPSVSPEFSYNVAVSQTAVQICAKPCNLYGFLGENNSSASDVYIQIFNALAVNVTVGTTTPIVTFRIPAGASFGKDAEDFPLFYMDTGLSVAVTSTRTGSSAPASACTVDFWFYSKY